MAAATCFDCEAVGPLAFDCVKYVLFLAGRVERRSEAVLLARDPTFTRVIDLGHEA